MRIVFIGVSGHVGTYLVPRLVEAEHEVINVSRAEGMKPIKPIRPGAWRGQALRTEPPKTPLGRWIKVLLELKPDVVIDLICFNLESAQQLVGSLREKVQHFLHCGTIWVLGHSMEVPATEETPRKPFGDYGTLKPAIEDFLDGPGTSITRLLGLCAASWLSPLALASPAIPPRDQSRSRCIHASGAGEEVTLPNLGMNIFHHVHADYVAQSSLLAIGKTGL